MVRNIIYFTEPGRQNTIATLEAARNRAQELGIKYVLIASSHGYTAIEASRVFKGSEIQLIAVTISEGYKEEGWNMTASERAEVEKTGVEVLTSQHALSGGVAESFGKDDSRLSIVAKTFYCFSQGMKVAVEIAIMAAEAGIIPAGNEIISVAGTGEGADTAIVLVPAYARNFKELRILEILSKPRLG